MLTRIRILGFLIALAVTCSAMSVSAGSRADHRSPRSQADEIRHQIVLSTYYGVFDWIEAQIQSGNTVVLRGQVRQPYAKSDVESRVRKVEGIAKVVNQIEVLPVSPADDAIRVATYRAIFRYNGPLFRYANAVNPSIHIVVKTGRVTLKGVVGDNGDRQLAYFAARYIPGVFEVNNDLTVSKS